MPSEGATESSATSLHISIIVPFYNAEKNSLRLLETLETWRHPSAELIFVDDGSTDRTIDVLNSFATRSQLPVTILSQENGGPGKARNTGLRRSNAEYVWFVDCDDDISRSALEQFDALRTRGYDFIDFNIYDRQATNTMDLDAGTHTNDRDLRPFLVKNYGAICTKIIRRDLLVLNNIWYPEHCFYEDNALCSVMPFFVTTFYKSATTGYVHHMDFESVTRQRIGPRYYDRLRTAAWGLRMGRKFATEPQEIEALEERFVDLFLVKTTMQIFGMGYPNTGFFDSLRSGRLIEATARFFTHVGSFWYLRCWVQSARVHRYYREVARELQVDPNALTRAEKLDRRSRFRLRGVWLSSYLLPSQREHFSRIRREAWGEVPDDSTWRQPQKIR